MKLYRAGLGQVWPRSDDSNASPPRPVPDKGLLHKAFRLMTLIGTASSKVSQVSPSRCAPRACHAAPSKLCVVEPELIILPTSCPNEECCVLPGRPPAFAPASDLVVVYIVVMTVRRAIVFLSHVLWDVHRPHSCRDVISSGVRRHAIDGPRSHAWCLWNIHDIAALHLVPARALDVSARQRAPLRSEVVQQSDRLPFDGVMCCRALDLRSSTRAALG